MKKIIKDGTLINEGKKFKAHIVIENDKIIRITEFLSEADLEQAEIIDATGCYVIPGVIDDQVHFREPGLTHSHFFYGHAECHAAHHNAFPFKRETGNCFPHFPGQLFLLFRSHNRKSPGNKKS